MVIYKITAVKEDKSMELYCDTPLLATEIVVSLVNEGYDANYEAKQVIADWRVEWARLMSEFYLE